MRPADVVTVVTVTHESSSTVGRLLARIGGALPVVVVDSGSGDWDRTAQVAAAAGARLVGILQNVGYGTASNRGAWTCSTPWLAFVNPDVAVEAADLVELCRAAEEHGFDAVAPRLVSTPGEPAVRSAPAGPPVPARVVPGACLVVRAEAFRAVGGFDERFFMFAEEDDLTERLRTAGGRTGRVDDVVAVTAGGGSSAGVGRRWAVAEREVGRCQLVLKRHGWAGFVLAVGRSALRIVTNPEMSPRVTSARQVARGLGRVVRLHGAPPVRDDVAMR